jgi:NTE family protein
LPFTSATKQIAAAYRRNLFKSRTLNAFPDDPRFVINATNLQSGALWRFMKPYSRDWKVGEIPKDRKQMQIAVAVGASSAFPPVLSPVRLRLQSSDYTPDSGGTGRDDLQKEPFTTHPILSDGGVYDNLGLETAWKRYTTILVSDAGGEMAHKGKIASLWPLQAYRVLNVIDNQVRSLRKRQVIDSYANSRKGAYWGIRTDISHYELPDALPCPYDKTLKLAETPTRLKKLRDSLQEQLINWGYAVCDAAIRKHVDQSIKAPDGFPYPDEGVG